MSVACLFIGVVLGGLVVHLCHWLRQREHVTDEGDVVLPAGVEVRDREGRVFTVTVDHHLGARDTRTPEDR